MKEYHKIDTVFERDTEGTKKLIPGKFRDGTVEFLKDARWVFTEKIDGTNIRVHWDGHRVEFGGRTDRAQMPASLVNVLSAMFCGEENEQLFEQKFGDTNVILFGEGYGPGIQKGGAYRRDVSFILFDVQIGGVFLERSSVEDIARAFGVDVVPVVLEGSIEEAVNFVRGGPPSTMGTAKMEGVVGRPAKELLDRRGRRVIVKLKVRDF